MKELHYELLKSKAQREIVKRRAHDLVAAAHDKSMVIFLDKTARPLFQLLRSSYPIIYPQEILPAKRLIVDDLIDSIFSLA